MDSFFYNIHRIKFAKSCKFAYFVFIFLSYEAFFKEERAKVHKAQASIENDVDKQVKKVMEEHLRSIEELKKMHEQSMKESLKKVYSE